MGRTLLLGIEAHLDAGPALADAHHVTGHIGQSVPAAVPEAGQVHSHAHFRPRCGAIAPREAHDTRQ